MFLTLNFQKSVILKKNKNLRFSKERTNIFFSLNFDFCILFNKYLQNPFSPLSNPLSQWFSLIFNGFSPQPTTFPLDIQWIWQWISQRISPFPQAVEPFRAPVPLGPAAPALPAHTEYPEAKSLAERKIH